MVSNFFHDRVAVGSRLEALAPRGKFVFDEASERPVVLISAGVGITPMIAMANFIAGEGQRTRTYRRTYFIHGARNGKAHAFADDIRQWADGHELLTAHIRYSRPADDDQLGKSYDSEGHIDLALLKSLLPFDDYDFYLCGPQPFMQALYDGLTGMGVSDAQIHYESFGPATVLKHDAANQRPSLIRTGAQEPVAVRFAGSNIDQEWSPDKGTLLDLAEAGGSQSGVFVPLRDLRHVRDAAQVRRPSTTSKNRVHRLPTAKCSSAVRRPSPAPALRHVAKMSGSSSSCNILKKRYSDCAAASS